MNIIYKPGTKFFYPRRVDSTGKQWTPQAIVLHIMAGTLYGEDSWVMDPRAQAAPHYGIGGKDHNEIHQYIYETDAAWGTGGNANGTWDFLGNPDDRPNFYTINVEMEGWPGNLSPITLDLAAELFADICYRNAIPIDRRHIIGHFEINQVSRQNCPFPAATAFQEMDQFVKSVKQKYDAAHPPQDKYIRLFKDKKQIGAYLNKEIAFDDFINLKADDVTFQGNNNILYEFKKMANTLAEEVQNLKVQLNLTEVNLNNEVMSHKRTSDDLIILKRDYEVLEEKFKKYQAIENLIKFIKDQLAKFKK